SQRRLLVPAVETTVAPFRSARSLTLDDLSEAKRVDVTKVVGAKLTCCWRCSLLVAEPQLMSTVPLATSGIRVDDVTETSLMVSCSSPSFCLSASTMPWQMSME